MKTRYQRTVLASAVALAMCAGLSPPAYSAPVPVQRLHVFSMGDVNGGFDGSTVGPSSEYAPNVGNIIDLGAGVQDPKSGTTLYPINSDFGFYVEDFVGAAQKTRDDGVYGEGWIGNILDTGNQVGVAVSNSKTDKFKVKYPMGTWCAGLGANSVKCSTEHYTVLEHVLTCNETVPYFYTTGDGTTQAPLIDPETGSPHALGLTCAIGALIDNLMMVVDGEVTATPLMPDTVDPTVPGMEANESTVLSLIAVTPDYAMTKKDDGKPLYRFGNMVKRPNDIRLYAKMALPDEWKEESADFEVLSATLTIEHLITNNPNDQIRPEDMENEGASGRLPGTQAGGFGLESNVDCFEGDGDEILQGTLFVNDAAEVAIPDPDGTMPGLLQSDPPYAYSEDLVYAKTNAWYTTTDRDPFANVDSSDRPGFETVGDIANGGPRWRLKPNKFGQDIPGLEVPTVECSPVPYSSGNIRYPVGNWTTTTINLLDWETGPENSPLKRSTGWVNAADNIQNYTEGTLYPGSTTIAFVTTGENGPSINGLPLTNDFDLAIYIKGDRKATAIYNATLDIVYDDGGPPPTPDLVLVSLNADPNIVNVGDTMALSTTVRNDHAIAVSTQIDLAAFDSGGYIPDSYMSETIALNPGETYTPTPAPEWIATHNAGANPPVWWCTAIYNNTNPGDEDTTNDSMCISTLVQPAP